MLLHQAVPGFERWFGQTSRVTPELRALVARDILDRDQWALMFVLGLTGSIGMGKSTTAEMFRAEGIAVHDSDATVHELYRGAAAPLVEAAFPGTVRDGGVDRGLLGAKVLTIRGALKRLEAIVHPLVRAARQAFRRGGAAPAAIDSSSSISPCCSRRVRSGGRCRGSRHRAGNGAKGSGSATGRA